MGISLSATRVRAVVTVAGLAVSAVLASCGGQPSSQGDDTTAHEALNPPTTTVAQAPVQPPTSGRTSEAPMSEPEETSVDPTTPEPTAAGVRLGCGTYCRNAGGYGATESSALPAATIVTTGVVTPDAEGYVPVTVTCDLPVECRGALLLFMQEDPDYGDGRSDLLVDPGATLTIDVPLTDAARDFLRSHSPTTLGVTADNLLVPPCEEITELAAQCAEFVNAPDYDLSKGDGINRLISGELTIVAPGTS